MRALSVVALSVLVACGGSAKDTGADTAASGPSADGATIFANHCAACHGSDGTNGSSPDLSVEVPSLDDAQLEEIITNGKGGMPAIAVPAGDLPTLVAYLRSTFG